MTTYIETVRRLPTMKPLKDGNAGNDVVKKASETASNDVKAEAEKIDFSKVEIEPLFKDFVDFETFSKSDFRAVKVLACEAVPKSKKLLKFTLDDGTGTKRTILSGIHAYYEPEELVGKTCIAIVNLPPRPMMGRRRKAPSSDGRRPHSGRRKALLRCTVLSVKTGYTS